VTSGRSLFAGLLRPLHDETLTDEQVRRGGRARIVAAVCAVAIDLLIWFALRDSTEIRRSALVIFSLYAIPVLSLDAVLAWFLLVRAERPRRWFGAVGGVAEISTMVAWVQLTGTVSSYFMVAVVAIIVVYRGFWSYRTGLTIFFAAVLFHFGLFILEEAGVIPMMSLYAAPATGLYAQPLFRWVVMPSIVWTYALGFTAANLMVNRIREQEQQLRDARRDLAKVAEGVRHGRLTGTRLGGYDVGELLGRGGMGEIYAARGPKGEVALKVLHPHLADDAQLFGRFKREAAAGARVGGGRVARVDEIGREGGLPFIAMELLRGEDLAAFLRRRGPLPIDEAVALTQRIADALEALHAAGIVHRDLKPANVFLVAGEGGAPPEVRLLDLGICKLTGDFDDEARVRVDAETALTHTSAIIGTPGFMAPEQARGRTLEVGPPTDVFAFGIIVYRALTGRLPFPSGDLLSAIEQVCTLEPPPPSQVVPSLPRDVDDVLSLALAKRRDERYQTAGELARDLALAASGGLPSTLRGRAARVQRAVAEAATIAPGAA